MSITEKEIAMRSLFSRRLGSLIESHGIQQNDLAMKIGVSESTVGKWILKKAMPRMGTIQKLADYFGVPKSYFLEESPAAPQDAPAPLSSDRRKIARIPVLGRVAAGIPIEAIENIEDYEERYISVLEDPHDYFALRIVGHSMEPRIWDGDVVIVHKQDDVDSGQIAVVLVNGDDATVKQLKKSSSGITLIGLNPTVYSPHFYTADEVISLPVRILGLVVEVRGKL